MAGARSRAGADWRPTREQLAAAANRRVSDVYGPKVRVLFVGINPSLYSAAVGHHFARPGNRFWPAVHAAGITPRRFSPFEDRRLADHGFGITNFVARATARADQVSHEEIEKGARALAAKVARRRIRCVAILGVTAYRIGFGRKEARIGRQASLIGEASVWVLPNPSGLNAHYQLADFARYFRELKREGLRA